MWFCVFHQTHNRNHLMLCVYVFRLFARILAYSCLPASLQANFRKWYNLFSPYILSPLCCRFSVDNIWEILIKICFYKACFPIAADITALYLHACKKTLFHVVLQKSRANVTFLKSSAHLPRAFLAQVVLYIAAICAWEKVSWPCLLCDLCRLLGRAVLVAACFLNEISGKSGIYDECVSAFWMLDMFSVYSYLCIHDLPPF